jgi:hypothetical protein
MYVVLLVIEKMHVFLFDKTTDLQDSLDETQIEYMEYHIEGEI